MTILQCPLMIGINIPVFDIRCENYCATITLERTISRAREHLLHSGAASLPFPTAAVTPQDSSLLLPNFVHIVDLAPYKWLNNQ